MLRKSLTLLTLIVVLLLAATGLAAADQNVALNPGANPNPRPSPSPSPVLVTAPGQVQSIAADGFTILKGDGQELSIAVTADTRFVILGDEDPAFEDLAVGDQVVVVGWPVAGDPNAITAKVVTVRKIQPQPIRVAGQVTAVDVPNLEFQMVVGELTRSRVTRELTVLVTSETEFVIPGVEAPGLDKLLVNDKVVVVSVPVAADADLAGRPPELAEITAATVYVQRPQPRPVKLLGRVAAMNAAEGAFDLVAADGSVSHIVTTADTQVSVPGIEDATLDDVKDGDIAQVMARPPAAEATEQVFTALSVAVQKPRPLTLTGRISAVDEDAGTFELVLDDDTTKAIKTNADTRFRVPGIEEPTIADLAAGQRAVVTALAAPLTGATADPLFELVAKLVVVQAPRPANLTGAIESVNLAEPSFALKLTGGRDTKQILTDADTTFVIPGLENPGLADLQTQIGSLALVKGVITPAGDILARSVVVKSQAPKRGSVAGEVTAVADVTGGTDLTVRTARGDQHVLVTAETVVRPAEAQPQVGSRIVAAGLWMNDGSLKALTLVVLPTRPTPTPEP
ncbi:MAG: hypothetical protein GXY76_21185 [Chloroflexi bacterium]|nr:hypothetical protein [Chloroflexota bacterium]